ncbi:MAG: cysteine desulfurase family protein [Myxococcota bacterium]
MSTPTTDPIYLDHNASTPLLPEALEAMLPYLRNEHGNPSSGHIWGRRARDAVEKARGQVARLIGCAPWELVFTGGGTEANNLAILGTLEARTDGRRAVVLSAVEHAAVQSPCERLAKRGYTVRTLPVDRTGMVTEEGWRAAIIDDVALVSVMHANNEVGTVQPIRALADRAHAVGARIHCDAAQSVGKTSVRVDELDVDLLSLAAHKFYGPKGVGALYIRQGVPVEPLVVGAGHERGLRPGTENVAGIVGMGVAAEVVQKKLTDEMARLEGLRAALLEGLTRAIPGLTALGHPVQRLCNTLNVSFPGVTGSSVLRHAPIIAASTGSACHGEEASHVLAVMGLPAELTRGAVRLSLGRLTGPQEVERAVAALVEGWRQARS